MVSDMFEYFKKKPSAVGNDKYVPKLITKQENTSLVMDCVISVAKRSGLSVKVDANYINVNNWRNGYKVKMKLGYIKRLIHNKEYKALLDFVEGVDTMIIASIATGTTGH